MGKAVSWVKWQIIIRLNLRSCCDFYPMLAVCLTSGATTAGIVQDLLSGAQDRPSETSRQDHRYIVLLDRQVEDFGLLKYGVSWLARIYSKRIRRIEGLIINMFINVYNYYDEHWSFYDEHLVIVASGILVSCYNIVFVQCNMSISK